MEPGGAFLPVQWRCRLGERGKKLRWMSSAGATELHPVTTRLEGCYSCRPCGDPSAQEKGARARRGRKWTGEKLQVRGQTCPITILKSYLPRQKVGVPQKSQGSSEAHLAYRSFKLLHPTRLALHRG